MTIMTNIPKQLKARLTRIEQELAELKASLPSQQIEPWYRQIVGDFAGDEAFREIIRLGSHIRSGKLKS
jgi:hypothetical protein